MKKIKEEILKIAREGRGVPVGYHCNSFGNDQIELLINLYRSLKVSKEKELFEKTVKGLLGSRVCNLRWMAYVVSKALNFKSTKVLIRNLIRENKIDERDVHISSLIIKDANQESGRCP